MKGSDLVSSYFWTLPITPIYKSKDGRQQKAFDALEWLAAMSSHIPDKGEQMVRYYGYYSNVCRGKRQKEDQDGLIPYIIEPQEDSKEYRKNWARLIRKIYEVDPLTCPKCQGKNSSAFSVRVPKSCGTSRASKNSVFCYEWKASHKSLSLRLPLVTCKGGVHISNWISQPLPFRKLTNSG